MAMSPNRPWEPSSGHSPHEWLWEPVTHSLEKRTTQALAQSRMTCGVRAARFERETAIVKVALAARFREIAIPGRLIRVTAQKKS